MRTTALRRVSVLVFCAAAVLGVFLGISAHRSKVTAQSIGECTLASLSGSYGFVGMGTVHIGESGGPEPHGRTPWSLWREDVLSLTGRAA
jgi:hypothetical protein